MSKYSPLGDFLKAWPDREITLTFEEIEEIIGSRLPPSAYAKRGFWNNNTNEYVRPERSRVGVRRLAGRARRR